VAVEAEYVFESENGPVSLAELFADRHQLVIYHAMWLYDEDRPCPACASLLDQIGALAHLHDRGTSFAAVSRGSLERMRESLGSRFNYDFHVTFDESVAPINYSYKSRAQLERAGIPVGEWEQPFDLHGLSVFLNDDGRVFHSYSTFGRGVDNLGFISNFLGLTPLGRQEEWEQPAGRACAFGGEARAAVPASRYSDEY